MTINNSDKAILNWQQFNIAAGETTIFNQASANSSVLNRVIGGDASQILGNLKSNGRVFLINQNGILFGDGAKIDVQGLVASSLNLADSDFLAGNFDFKGGAGKDITFQGATITAGTRGHILVAAKNINVDPDYFLKSKLATVSGQITLAAGTEVQAVDTKLGNMVFNFVTNDGTNTINQFGKLISTDGIVSLYADNINHAGVIAGGMASDNVTDPGLTTVNMVANNKITLAHAVVSSAPPYSVDIWGYDVTMKAKKIDQVATSYLEQKFYPRVYASNNADITTEADYLSGSSPVVGAGNDAILRVTNGNVSGVPVMGARKTTYDVGGDVTLNNASITFPQTATEWQVNAKGKFISNNSAIAMGSVIVGHNGHLNVNANAIEIGHYGWDYFLIQKITLDAATNAEVGLMAVLGPDSGDDLTVYAENGDLNFNGIINAPYGSIVLAADKNCYVNSAGDTSLSWGCLEWPDYLKPNKRLVLQGDNVVLYNNLKFCGSEADFIANKSFQNKSSSLVWNDGALNAATGKIENSKLPTLWNIYAVDPNDFQYTLGTLGDYNYKQYNASTSDVLLGTGNGIIYSTPVYVSGGLQGEVKKTYDQSTKANLTAANISSTASGAVQGDVVNVKCSVDLNSAKYDNKNAGTGKTVVADATVAVLSAVDANGTPVYGYQGTTKVSGNVGTIDKKTVSAKLDGEVVKVYDGNNIAYLKDSNKNLDGVLAGDDVSVHYGKGSYDNKEVGNQKLVTADEITLSGSDADNYQLEKTSVANNIGKILPAPSINNTIIVPDKRYGVNATETKDEAGNVVGWKIDEFYGNTTVYRNH